MNDPQEALIHIGWAAQLLDELYPHLDSCNAESRWEARNQISSLIWLIQRACESYDG